MADGNYGDPIVSSFKRRDLYSTQASRHQVAADKRQTCMKQHIDKSINRLYTLVNEVTRLVYGNISLETLRSLNYFYKLDEMSDGTLSQALKAEELFDFVIIRFAVAWNSSSLLDKSVLEDTKVTPSARSVSSILNDLLNPFYPLVK